MSLWRQLTRGLRAIANRTAADRDVADEVQHYFDEATAALTARGLSPDAARRAATLELGNATIVREQVRAYGWENAIGTLAADLRYATRRLRRSPGFTIVSVVTLALGIGASTAIFSAVNPILFEPLPYPHASRIVTIWDHAVGGGRFEVTFGTARELAERSRSLEAIAAMKAWQPTMTGPAEPERLDGQRVGAGYFRVLGVRPVRGRDFDEREDRASGPNVVILGDGLWRRRFGADTTIVGRQITLNDSGYLVIGIMPKGFENVLAPSAEVWAPLQYDASLPLQGREWGHHLRAVARLAPDVHVEKAAREIDAIAHAPVREFPRAPWAALSQGLIVNALQDDVTSGVRPALIAVLGAVLLVLAIACVNVTNLLLGRGAQRRGEFALRAALGAGRSRVMRQVLAESLLLAALGGALGMIVATLGVAALVALSPPGLPRVNAIRVDGAVFAFGTALTTLIGIAFGSIPGLQASREDVRAALQQGARQTAGGHHAARRILVVAEVALALVLLVSAGLLMRSLERLFAVAPGFDAQHLLTMQVQTSGRQFADSVSVHRFFDRALDEVRRVPGVTGAAWTSQLPLSGDVEKYGLQFEANAARDNADEDHSALRCAVSPGYFETIGIPLRRGRVLDARDAADAPPSVVINESLASANSPGAIRSASVCVSAATIGPGTRSSAWSVT